MTITIDKAYELIFSNMYKGQYSPICIDIDGLYVFAPRPLNIRPNEKYFTGSIFPAVNKKDGTIVSFDISKHYMQSAKTYKLKFKKSKI